MIGARDYQFEKDANTNNERLSNLGVVFKQKRSRNDLFLICDPLIGGILQPFSLFKSTKQHFM